MEYNNQDVRRQDRLLDETRAFEILRDGSSSRHDRTTRNIPVIGRDYR